MGFLERIQDNVTAVAVANEDSPIAWGSHLATQHRREIVSRLESKPVTIRPGPNEWLGWSPSCARTPDFFAGAGVMRDDDTGLGPTLGAATPAGNHLAVGDDRPGPGVCVKGLLRRLGQLLHPRTSQDVQKPVVAFVAGVLEHRTLLTRPGR